MMLFYKKIPYIFYIIMASMDKRSIVLSTVWIVFSDFEPSLKEIFFQFLFLILSFFFFFKYKRCFDFKGNIYLTFLQCLCILLKSDIFSAICLLFCFFTLKSKWQKRLLCFNIYCLLILSPLNQNMINKNKSLV